MNKIVFAFLFLAVPTLAAQYGKIIVDQAAVHEFPNASSNVIGQAVRDQEMAASNAPTENFYKVRLPDGKMGWVSGNDIFVSKAPIQKTAEGTPQPTPYPNDNTTAAETAEEVTTKEPKEYRRAEPAAKPERSRILLAGGLGSLSYGGIPAAIAATELNYSMTGLAEFQFKLSEIFFWAVRAEYFTTSSGEVTIASGLKENITQKMLPLQVGLNYSPLQSRRFRLGVGAYLGFTVISSMKVTLDDSRTATPVRYEVEYPSMDPCGTLALQSSIGLSDRSGILLEVAYRYQKTGNFDSTTLGSSIPSFAADYSGITGRLGFEFKF